MILTKDNYEFMMFELLEGNLSKEECALILEEIEKDEFYKKEWILMQHTVVSPDLQLVMPEKERLLKPADKVLLFHFSPTLKIAASLLLIGSIVFWYLVQNQKPTAISRTQTTQVPEQTIVQKQHSAEQNVAVANAPVITNVAPRISKTAYRIATVPSNPGDSVASAYTPELIQLSTVSPDKIGYTLTMDNVDPNQSIRFKRPVYKASTKYAQALTKAKELRSTANMVLHDLPNLSLRLTPHFKDKKPSIGFEIKGETIYANALIEMK